MCHFVPVHHCFLLFVPGYREKEHLFDFKVGKSSNFLSLYLLDTESMSNCLATLSLKMRKGSRMIFSSQSCKSDLTPTQNRDSKIKRKTKLPYNKTNSLQPRLWLCEAARRHSGALS